MQDMTYSRIVLDHTYQREGDMLDWYTKILPTVFGPLIIIGGFVLWYVVPTWLKSFDKEGSDESR